jgi:Glycine cleavage system H protein (lipoate-binding)
LSGEILSVNQRLEDSPEVINSDPYGDGWFFTMRLADPADLDELMSAEEYDASCQD